MSTEQITTLQGHALIGGISEAGKAEATFFAYDPVQEQAIEPLFHTVDATQIDRACQLAKAAFDPYRATSDQQRSDFLRAIAQQIVALGDDLIVRAMAESGLPRARLEGERGRTVAQLTLFADLLLEGAWRDVRRDVALPQRQPPRPELRMQFIGVGPVAVFGASNFPLAFSVAGGDTASALAAGCPVVVKGHPAHPGTSELVGLALQRAVTQCRLPAGVFALLTGVGNAVGETLVRHPAIQAVGFTGSRQGGLALMAIAAARPQPIPVYAEMSSINPMYLLPQALARRGQSLAQGFAASLTMGVGQFCTNPGLVLGLKGADFDRFYADVQAVLSGTGVSTAAASMLTPGIAANYRRGTQLLAQHPQVTVADQPVVSDALLPSKVAPALFRTDAAAVLADPALTEEIFGPASLLVACDTVAQLLELTEHLEGQLTATLHMEDSQHAGQNPHAAIAGSDASASVDATGAVDPDSAGMSDLELAQRLLPVLERKVGRILVNGFPTGVEVATAMVHGGPFPATSDGRTTSVGTAAIQRFLRPVSYQNMPQSLLPPALRDRSN